MCSGSINLRNDCTISRVCWVAPQVCILGEGAAQEMHTIHRAQDYNNYSHFTTKTTQM